MQLSALGTSTGSGIPRFWQCQKHPLFFLMKLSLEWKGILARFIQARRKYARWKLTSQLSEEGTPLGEEESWLLPPQYCLDILHYIVNR